MSSYLYELEKFEYPDKMLCPFHREKFKKNGKFWKCPHYRECGCSIGSRRLSGYVPQMWIKQTKVGRAWAARMASERADAWWDEWPKLFAAACFVAMAWKS